MNDIARLSFWLSCIIFLERVTSQLNYTENVYKPSFFDIGDGENLLLKETFCFKSVKVKAYLTNYTLDGEKSLTLWLNVSWESDHSVLSLTVESDSQNDIYCDSKGRFSYHRKLTNKSNHTFPDMVNHGSRYIPIKLDCKYIIILEVMHSCPPLKLKYRTPVCLSESICSCRDISLPAPDFNILSQENGITVQWEIPPNATVNVQEISKITILLQVAHSPVVFKPKILPTEFTTDVWENPAIRSGTHFFPLNSDIRRSYILKGVYDNVLECSRNITQLTFDFPELSEGNSNVLLYSIVYILIICALAMGILYFFLWRLRRLLCNKVLTTELPLPARIYNNRNISAQPEFRGTTSVNNPEYCSDKFVIDYKKLVIEKKLNEGHFGVVYLATSTHDIGGYNVFAVKQLKDTATSLDVSDFREEINTFQIAGDHRHVVRMIGYCNEPLSIVMEYVPFNLLQYLKYLRDEFETRKTSKGTKLRNSYESLPSNYVQADAVEWTPLGQTNEDELERALDSGELESFGLQIARGMAHLERKSIVHRDLAARNILVDNCKTLKVSDFGMSRSGIYVSKSKRQFPLRWMSPEALSSGTFSSKSDVWSYGIVLWEIGTLGGFPYSHLENDEVFSFIRKGGHPDQPESVTVPLYNLMLRCWSHEPEDRPSFDDIVQKIENMRQKAYVSFTDLREYYNFPPTEEDLHENFRL